MTNVIPFNETKEEKRARWDAEDRRRENSRRDEIHNKNFYHSQLTVAELIRILQTHDQNALVEARNGDGVYATISNSDIDDVGICARTGCRTVFIGE